MSRDTGAVNLPWYVFPNVFASKKLEKIYWKTHYKHSFNWLHRIEKYRPSSLDELISHEEIISTSKLSASIIKLQNWFTSICHFVF